MHEIIASLDGYFCSARRNFDWNDGGSFWNLRLARQCNQGRKSRSPAENHLLVKHNPAVRPPRICRRHACHYNQTIGAVSSVVERLVYTERVGGSNPSPPIVRFPIFNLD